MIKKIGIENFRVFKDYTEFEIAPITILTGPNNSGKSSLIKTISLLINSFKQKGLNELIFNDGKHNLGTFENVLSWKGDSDKLKIVLDFPLNYFNEKFNLELSYKKNNENASLDSLKIFNEHRKLLHIAREEEIFGTDYAGFYNIDLNYIKEMIHLEKGFNEENELFYYEEENTNNTELLFSYDKNGDKDIMEKYKDFFKSFEKSNHRLYTPFEPEDYKDVSNWTKDLLSFYMGRLSSTFIYDGKKLGFEKDDCFTILMNDCFEEEFKKGEKPNPEKLQLFENFLEDLPKISYRVDLMQQNLINFYFHDNIQRAIEKVVYAVESIDHLTAKRGSQSRIYSNKSYNEIDEILKNYAPIIDNSDFLKQSFQILGINGSLDISRQEGVATQIYIIQGDKKTTLADFGFGYSQIIPILLKILIIDDKNKDNFMSSPYKLDDLTNEEKTKMKDYINLERKKPRSKSTSKLNLSEIWLRSGIDYDFMEKLTNYAILIIEEPESNLHPNFQSKLADILVLAQKHFNIKFILETHSEYLIRKLQYLTAKNEIGTEDISIYYFNDDQYVNIKEPKVKLIKINQSGVLSDSFGPGFIDEATTLQFDLIKLRKEQNN